MSMDLWPEHQIRSNSKFYPLSSTKKDIDLRQEFIDLIDGNGCDPQRGHWVLLKRMDQRQRCSCWNKVGSGDDKYTIDRRKYDEPDKDCKICLGEGWLYSEEPHKVRRRVATPPPGQGGIEEQADFAILGIPYIIYYFRYYVNPKEQDKIIEIDINNDGTPKRPIVKREMYNITMAEPFRDINGRIEYWRCAVKKEELRYGKYKQAS